MKLIGFTNWQNEKYEDFTFDTNKKLCLSYRGWGALMAQVLDIEKDESNGYNMSYCRWAWLPQEEQVLPRG